MPILFIGFIIICFAVSHAINRSKKLENKINEDFWEREQQGNFVRKQPTDDLVRITLSPNLPYEDNCDDELKPIMRKINELKTKDIINLTGITNTELQLTYGLPNLDYLMECDGNFTNLSVCLNSWSEYLLSHNREADALKVLEFAVECRVDVGNIYTSLAKIYVANNQPDKVKTLIDICSSLNSITSELTCNKLREILDN